VIVMRVDDTVGRDVDRGLDGVLVVLNASDEATTQTVPALAGRTLMLSPVQAKGSDPVVKATTWVKASGTVTVPARTVAVLVEKQVKAHHHAADTSWWQPTSGQSASWQAASRQPAATVCSPAGSLV
jgi:hypothetical protein